jgi:Tfp pilus assembly protein PilF
MKASVHVGRADAQPSQRFSLHEAARILQVPEASLRKLARAGLLTSQGGPIGPPSFGYQDLLVLRTTQGLIESGVPMRRIRRIWSSLRDQLAAGAPLSGITLETEGEDVVASDGSARWEPDSGQVLLDFEAAGLLEHREPLAKPRLVPEPPAREEPLDREFRPGPDSPETDVAHGPGAPRRPVLRIVPRASEAPGEPEITSDMTAEDWYEAACEFELTSPERAIEAYEHAVELDPFMADAHLNLGRQLHMAGERGRAEPCYREAVRLAPDDPTPHFNLGVLLEESGRKDEAIHAYRQAIARDPDFADAHCNLGLLLESLGRRQEAMQYLMAARKLSGAE